MKRKLMYLVVVSSAIVLLACSGLPGKFFGVGSLPSVNSEGDAATFRFWLIADDKEPDDNHFADTFRGEIVYTDEAAGVDIRGVVADAVDEGLSDEEVGGVYEEENEYGYPQYGAFFGYWTLQSPSDFEPKEGIFVVYVADDSDGSVEEGDGLWIRLFESIEKYREDDPCYENLNFTYGDDIRYVPTRQKKDKK